MINHKSHRYITLFHFLAAVVWGSCLALLTSCNKMPVNGVLDGQWQLMSIETPDSTRHTRDDLVFLSVQLQLTQWNNHRSGAIYFSHFLHKGDSILFFDLVHPSQHSLDSNNDVYVTSEEMSAGEMDDWGIHTLDMRYRVQTLTYDDLVLEKVDTTLRFRKF